MSDSGVGVGVLSVYCHRRFYVDTMGAAKIDNCVYAAAAGGDVAMATSVPRSARRLGRGVARCALGRVHKKVVIGVGPVGVADVDAVVVDDVVVVARGESSLRKSGEVRSLLSVCLSASLSPSLSVLRRVP